MTPKLQQVPLSTTSEIRDVTGSTFEKQVLKGVGPIVVEFMSYGCEHCRAIEPVLQKVAEMVKSKGQIFRLNIAVDSEIGDLYGIRATPTLVMFLNGKQVGQVEGPQPKVSSLLTAIAQPFRAMK
jgi:thioredoxin 1